MTENRIHLAGRVDQAVRDYFAAHSAISVVAAKELMPWFLQKGIFKKDHRDGLPIRKLLPELDDERKLHLIRGVRVERKAVNRNWFFSR